MLFRIEVAAVIYFKIFSISKIVFIESVKTTVCIPILCILPACKVPWNSMGLEPWIKQAFIVIRSSLSWLKPM